MCIGGVDTSKHDSAGKSSSNEERRGEGQRRALSGAVAR
jgi:hypothetical protein